MERHLAARANALLLGCAKEKRFATPLVLQKMMYLNYVVHLQKGGELLKYLTFEAWIYGPVIPILYHYYKNMRNNSNVIITKRVESNGAYPVLQHDNTIKQTVKKYSALDSFELIDLTHNIDGAWYRAFCEGHNQTIEHAHIRQEFCNG